MRDEGGGVAPIGFEEFVAARSPALLRTAWLLTGHDCSSSTDGWASVVRSVLDRRRP